jgi:hypothetical protein
MVGEEIFSEPQGPENRENRIQPRQRPSSRIGRVTRHQPTSNVGERLAEKRKSRLGVVQSAGPATKRRSIGHAVGIFERRRRLLPGTMLHKTPPQCLTARQQTVMGVRERKQRQEGEGLSATGAATPTDPNPVVMRIVGLLAATSMSDDRVAFTSGASPQDDFGAACRPIGFELVWRDGKWDKLNRTSTGALPSGVDLPRSEPEAELLPPEEKNPTGREYRFSPLTF